MIRTLLRKLLTVGYILLITLVALEMSVRIWGFSEPHIYDPIYTSFDRTEDIPYIHKPNLTEARARGLAVINTDSLGLRTKRAGASYGAKPLNQYRIALAGDSYTFGEGVTRTEDTYAQVLEDRLNRHQQALTVRVFNFGASAYSVKQMAATLRYRMLDLQPDLVVMAVIPSDFNLARTPMIDAEGYLVDQRLSSFSPPGAAIRRAFRQIHLAYVLREIGVRWLYPAPDMNRIFSRGEIPDTYDYVREFKQMAEEQNVPCVIVLLPRMHGAWGRLPDQLERDRIAYIDLSNLKNEFTKEQYVASRFDPHPSAAVHHRIGESLAEYVQHLPGFVQ